MLDRSRSLQIYVKPGIKEDDLLIRVWEASRRLDRPQDVFRSMLRAGLMAMLESGELPECIIEECGLDALLERRRNRSRKLAKEPVPQNPVAGHPHYQWPAHGQPVYVPPSPVAPPLYPETHTYNDDYRQAPQHREERAETSRPSVVEVKENIAPTSQPTPEKPKMVEVERVIKNEDNSQKSEMSKRDRFKNLM